MIFADIISQRASSADSQQNIILLTSGQRINLLTDIEKTLEKLPTVKQVVVVTMEKKNMQGQQLAAFCMLQGDAQLSPEQIREQCFDLLPHYAHPERIGVVDAFPILPSVKIDRQALRSQTTG